MKKLIGTALIFTAQAHAKNLSCWNVYSKFSTRPAVTAEILSNDKLKNIFVEEMIYASIRLNPSLVGPVRGREVTKDPIFQGQREFPLKFKSRLMLPTKMNNESLQAARLRERNSRKNNGILILADLGSRGNLKSEKIVRLFCEVTEGK